MHSKKRFVKVSHLYNDNAHVQRRMARLLISYIKNHHQDSFDKILEIGCGTGILTDLISRELSYNELHLCDLDEFLMFKGKYKFLKGDIEEINLQDRYDLIISNAVFQWLRDVRGLILRLRANLTDGGFFAFTTFGQLNLREVKETTSVGLDYYSVDWYKMQLSQYFKILYAGEEVLQLYFHSPVHVLKHMKYTGVNSIRKMTWTKNHLNNFIASYEKYKTEKGYLLTYHPLYFILKKI